MKIIDIQPLAIINIKVVRFARFCDHRGYFTEHYRKSDFESHLEFKKDMIFVQTNESYSKKGTIRGLHFQWNPYMGKLVRTITGRMIDLVLDIRIGSPSFGKIILHDMPAGHKENYQDWIWVPPGFAHGNIFPEDTIIEYFCTGEYNSGCEAGISPLASDIDWTWCDNNLKKVFKNLSASTALITEKDKNGFSIEGWKSDKRSENFIYGQL